MSTIGTKNNLQDVIRRTAPDGSIERDIAELLTRNNMILQTLGWRESNRPTGHQITQRVTLPTVTFTRVNDGIPTTKSTTNQRIDDVARMEALSDVPLSLMEVNGWSAAYRASEDKAFVEAFGQEFASSYFYADSAIAGEEFTGLTPRYSTPGSTRNTFGYYMIAGGGSGNDNTSIWLTAFGEQGVQGIYAKGTQAGIQVIDKANQWVTGANGFEYEVMRSLVKWQVGVTVKRPGSSVRICNIDVSALIAQSSAADLIELMVRAKHLHEGGQGQLGQLAYLVNKTTYAYLEIQALNKSTLGLHNIEDTFGKQILAFQGIPILVNDALLNAEATVTGTFQSTI